MLWLGLLRTGQWRWNVVAKQQRARGEAGDELIAPGDTPTAEDSNPAFPPAEEVVSTVAASSSVAPSPPAVEVASTVAASNYVYLRAAPTDPVPHGEALASSDPVFAIAAGDSGGPAGLGHSAAELNRVDEDICVHDPIDPFVQDGDTKAFGLTNCSHLFHEDCITNWAGSKAVDVHKACRYKCHASAEGGIDIDEASE